MRAILYLIVITTFILSACKNDHTHDPASPDAHTHSAESPVDQNQGIDAAHEHEAIKIQFTEYTDQFELFAEADPFVIGQTSNILAHFSELPTFKALEKGSIDVTLNVGGYKVSQSLAEPSRKGIYSFDIKPEMKGNASLEFLIHSENVTDKIVVSGLKIYESEDQAIHEEEEFTPSSNASVFTKEQSWKVEFKTELPVIRPFGKIIKAVGQVQIPNCEEIILTSKTAGILNFSNDHLIEGKKVWSNQTLFTISSDGFVDDNLEIRYSEAKNALERSKAEFERLDTLFKQKLVTQQAFLVAKNEYQDARLQLDNLTKNFKSSGQRIKSPMNGFIKQLMIQNGQYVEAGKSLATIINNKKILIKSDVSLQDAAELPKISSVIIKDFQNKTTKEFKDLNTDILTIGQHTNPDNFLVPVSFELDNLGNNIPGSFVELSIKTKNTDSAITVPNSALLEEQGKLFVFVQANPEVFDKQYVTIGNTDGINTEIKAGLRISDRIVSKGAIFVKLAQNTGALDAHSGHVH